MNLSNALNIVGQAADKALLSGDDRRLVDQALMALQTLVVKAESEAKNPVKEVDQEADKSKK